MEAPKFLQAQVTPSVKPHPPFVVFTGFQGAAYFEALGEPSFLLH